MEEKCACCTNTIGDLPFIVDSIGQKICHYCECDLSANYSIENDPEFWTFIEGSDHEQAA